jgi:hypothetical protein
MQEIIARSSTETDAERLEFELLLEWLTRSPRLANLLRYVGGKYFSGESGQLTEYNIATEVFGRSKTVFDAGEDAIARVEAHRLRKRLKEYYEGPGKDHAVQLSIPPGTYAPVFTRKPQEEPQRPSLEPAEASVQGTFRRPTENAAGSGSASRGENSAAPASPAGKPRFRYAVWIVAGLACLAVVYAILHFHTAPPRTADSNGAAPPPAVGPPASMLPAELPLHVLAGYSGSPQMDSAGAIWKADQYFHGGGTWQSPGTVPSRTSDPLLFQQWRTGDFSYDIPLRPGSYELHLYFFTSEPSSEDLSTFSVKINGEFVLPGFDVNSDAMGENIADERVFRDVSPAGDGLLHVAFTSERGAPRLNALEVLQGIPHAQLPIRIVTQRTPYTDHNGQFWHPDNYFMNGRMSESRQQTAGSPDPNLFDTERYGHFAYAIPADTRDRYTLVLHFAEFYFGPQTASGGGAGSRVFRVMCNGNTLLDDFDIFKEAGSLHVVTKTFYHLKPTAQGKLNLTFEPIRNNATLSGIEVLDESQ